MEIEHLYPNLNFVTINLGAYKRVWKHEHVIVLPKSVYRFKHTNLNAHEMKMDDKCMKLAGKTYIINYADDSVLLYSDADPIGNWR